MNETPVLIRPARLSDINAMQAIERASGSLFAGVGMTDIAAHPPLEHETLAAYVQDGRAWVAEVGRRLVGYAVADIVDGHGHLEQVSVHPDYGRRGLGRRLIGAVVDWAASKHLPSLTLLTFRDVPWNGPYYAALGFEMLPDTELGPELLALRDHETHLGLDRDARIAMSMTLASSSRPDARSAS